jgi:NADP-dependent 3-hydroxy acid dehydrogenase YdfG
MKIFLTGASSGVGKACYELLKTNHTIVAPSSQEFDLGNFAHIDSVDLSDIDCVINCAGVNPGSYQGWKNNQWQKQQHQVDVNFTGALLLVKQYARQRNQGQFVYMTSSNIDDPIAHNIFYTAAKHALRYSIDTVRKECPDIVFTEICPGKIKTNMLQQNYQATKTAKEIEEIYAQGPTLSANEVAEIIVFAIDHKLDHITILPHTCMQK